MVLPSTIPPIACIVADSSEPSASNPSDLAVHLPFFFSKLALWLTSSLAIIFRLLAVPVPLIIVKSAPRSLRCIVLPSGYSVVSALNAATF